MTMGDKRDPLPTTQWTVVVEAMQDGGPTAARGAFSTLYTSYYQPLAAYVQRRGYGYHDTEDILQSYFLNLAESGSIAGLSRSDWKLRRFLLPHPQALSGQLEQEPAGQEAGRRGSACSPRGFTLQIEDPQAAEGVSDPAFDVDWALMILGHVRTHLRDEYRAKGQAERFVALEPLLSRGPGNRSYLEVGDVLGMSEDAVKQAVRRMRTRYREILEEHIARTVCDRSEVGGEVEYLIEVTGGLERKGGRAEDPRKEPR